MGSHLLGIPCLSIKSAAATAAAAAAAKAAAGCSRRELFATHGLLSALRHAPLLSGLITRCSHCNSIFDAVQPRLRQQRKQQQHSMSFSASYCSHRFDMLLHDATCFVSTMVLLSACCCHMKGNTMLMLRRGSE